MIISEVKSRVPVGSSAGAIFRLKVTSERKVMFATSYPLLFIILLNKFREKIIEVWSGSRE